MRWPMRQNSPEGAWAKTSERGSDLGLRLLVWGVRRLGRAPVKIFLRPVALYFCAFAPAARRASRAYLEQLEAYQGLPPRRIGFRDFYRHIHTFADVLLDRFAIWSGEQGKFKIDLHGREHMEPLVEQGRGGFLIGAHFGSFDVLRLIAREAGIPVNVIMYTGNAEKVNAAFEALDPESMVRVIDIDPTSSKAAFEIRSCVARGEFVAILGDRVILGGPRSRVSYAEFLGRQAPISEGPFLIAMALRIPLILCISVKTGPEEYEVFLETLASGEAIDPSQRKRIVQERIELFVTRLEEFCLRAPLQWFNFYDFWSGVDGGGQTTGKTSEVADGGLGAA